MTDRNQNAPLGNLRDKAAKLAAQDIAREFDGDHISPAGEILIAEIIIRNLEANVPFNFWEEEYDYASHRMKQLDQECRTLRQAQFELMEELTSLDKYPFSV